MKNLTLENIARVCGGTYYGPADKLQECLLLQTAEKQKKDVCLYLLWGNV